MFDLVGFRASIAVRAMLNGGLKIDVERGAKINHSSFIRFMQGSSLSLDNAAKLCAWGDLDFNDYIEGYEIRRDTLSEVLRILDRDENLSVFERAVLYEMFQSMYKEILNSEEDALN